MFFIAKRTRPFIFVFLASTAPLAYRTVMFLEFIVQKESNLILPYCFLNNHIAIPTKRFNFYRNVIMRVPASYDYAEIISVVPATSKAVLLSSLITIAP